MEPIRHAIETFWRDVFGFCSRMTLDRAQARKATEETFLRAYVGADKIPTGDHDCHLWLLRIASHVVESTLSEAPDVSFDLLDDNLRSEATRTGEIRSLTDPQKNFLLWELKSGCMTAVVNCLAPGERVAFVLGVVQGLSEEDAARALGITEGAFKVRLSRARKKVTDYLAPRCEHVDPRNPCHCPSRLGVAIKSGFLPQPTTQTVQIRKPYGRYGATLEGEDAPMRDVVSIYQSLPEPDPPEDLGAAMIAQLESGAWAAYAQGSSPGRR